MSHALKSVAESAAQHTPGPWETRKHTDTRGWTVSAGNSIASVRPRAEAEANARLIAAAPDHALVLRFLTSGRMRWEPFSRQARPGEVHGELCFNGLRHATSLDEFGCPKLTHALRADLEAAGPA